MIPESDAIEEEEVVQPWNGYRRLIRYVLWFAEIVATVIVTCKTWEEGRDNSDCTELRWWILVFTSRLLLLIPLTHIALRMLQRGEQVPLRMKKMLIWLQYFTFFCFLMGQSWLYDSTCSESWLLEDYTLTLIIVTYVQLGFRIILLILFCFCFPCIYLLKRILRENRNVSKRMLRGLDTRKFSADSGDEKNPEEDPMCVICLLNYENGDELKILPCRHEYHSGCIDEWLGGHNRTCPTCRHDITVEFNEPSEIEVKSP